MVLIKKLFNCCKHKVNSKTILAVCSITLLMISLDSSAGNFNHSNNRHILKNKNIPPVTVTGSVTDEKNMPLAGVTIRIKNGKSLGTTDKNGNFSIEVPGNSSILIFSYVGYNNYEIAASDQPLNIKLQPNENDIDQVVVTSFGIKKQQEALGYATTKITSKELTESGNTNFASALYGKAPGLVVRTQPGGASSAVSVQIRGINSLSYNQPPLYVVDGVIIRNQQQYGSAGFNNGGFYSDQRIEGNGVLDINPNDIESIDILKGGSATALYGSDAEGGVIVITTKKGKRGKGAAVDFNYFGTVEQAAFLPKYQNEYGQGYDIATNVALGFNPDGSVPDTASPAGWRPNFRAYANFGPKMMGQKVRWWDGSIQSYSPQPDNYRDIFRIGNSSTANLSVSNQTDNLNYRFSYTRLDYNGIQRESGVQKNTFNLNSTVKVNNNISIDLASTYVNTITKNRPYQTNRLANSFDGFFGREEKMDLVRDKYLTPDGFEYVSADNPSINPAEAFIFRVRPNLYDYFFNTLKDTYVEKENRVYSSLTFNWSILKNLKLRLRGGNDFTARTTEFKNYNNYPVAFNPATSSTGAYGISNGNYSILYGDALLTYNVNVTKDINVGLTGGYTARRETYLDESSSTSNGLVTANFFAISNSYGIPNTSYTRQYLIKEGIFGLVDFSVKDYLFIEGALRQESTSTLPPQNNTYYYPAVNGSFVFTNLLKDKTPSFLSSGKIRASYTQNGNPAPIYVSNIAYGQTSLQTINGTVPQLSLSGNYGNNTLQPERKKEYEFGTELSFFNNRAGLDVAYYTNRISNQILPLSISPSNGASSQIVNIGEIGNKGLEVGLSGVPVSTSKFKWNVRLNYSFNNSTVFSITPNTPEIVVASFDGSIKVVARPGEALGNIYSYLPQKATDKGGQLLVNDGGLYQNDQTNYVKVGNILPKAVGGLVNTLNYKSLSLSFNIDYRLGGQLVSTPLKYGINGGMYTSTLKYRDAAHGGLSYYTDAQGNNVAIAASATTGPNGETVYHDGLILPGVLSSGEPNNIIINAAYYYFNQFGAGDPSSLNMGTAIYDNSYVKLREVVIGFELPRSFYHKLGMTNFRVSLIGRNLFYLYRTLKNLDPETTLGSQWWNQGIDQGSIPSTRSYGISLNANF